MILYLMAPWDPWAPWDQGPGAMSAPNVFDKKDKDLLNPLPKYIPKMNRKTKKNEQEKIDETATRKNGDKENIDKKSKRKKSSDATKDVARDTEVPPPPPGTRIKGSSLLYVYVYAYVYSLSMATRT